MEKNKVSTLQDLSQIEQYAMQYNVPIMEKEGMQFVQNFIIKHGIVTILELGSAIGYSALKMSQCNLNISIVSIERDQERYKQAKNNQESYDRNHQITFVFEDALSYEPLQEFDMIFIDAAKAQYIKFFEKYAPYLKNGGYIISDNLEFHGLVNTCERIKNRNTRQLVAKIKKYILFLSEHDKFKTTFYSIGDGIACSKKIVE